MSFEKSDVNLYLIAQPAANAPYRLRDLGGCGVEACTEIVSQ
jgi:hypothetical protein